MNVRRHLTPEETAHGIEMLQAGRTTRDVGRTLHHFPKHCFTVLDSLSASWNNLSDAFGRLRKVSHTTARLLSCSVCMSQPTSQCNFPLFLLSECLQNPGLHPDHKGVGSHLCGRQPAVHQIRKGKRLQRCRETSNGPKLTGPMCTSGTSPGSAWIVQTGMRECGDNQENVS